MVIIWFELHVGAPSTEEVRIDGVLMSAPKSGEPPIELEEMIEAIDRL